MPSAKEVRNPGIVSYLASCMGHLPYNRYFKVLLLVYNHMYQIEIFDLAFPWK